MNTKQMIDKARALGISVKMISEISNINIKTLYNYTCGRSKLSEEKQQKIQNALRHFFNAYYSN